ncbi:UPF0175 family protein [uncultured Microbulbifer sp.]|uniref:UPF0175 family protein n=1 Tax=uncultured Microbulbifer sp. TaxID=348147 RepID=UPI0026194C87|nr:UPF0175 family protein [uncultured Microbulbifer sp.]
MNIELDDVLMAKISVDEREAPELLAITLYKYKRIHGSLAGKMNGVSEFDFHNPLSEKREAVNFGVDDLVDDLVDDIKSTIYKDIMKINRIVISDTTALTHPTKFGALHILQKLSGEILIPTAALSELAQVKRTQPGALQALTSPWIRVAPINNQTVVSKLTQHLDLGESEAIGLSLELNADVLIIDEVTGPTVAKKLVHSTDFRLGEDIYKLALTPAGQAQNRQPR